MYSGGFVVLFFYVSDTTRRFYVKPIRGVWRVQDTNLSSVQLCFFFQSFIMFFLYISAMMDIADLAIAYFANIAIQ